MPGGGKRLIGASVIRPRGPATEKIAKTGKPLVTAKGRVHAGEGDAFVHVIALREAACAALLALEGAQAAHLKGL